MLETLSALVAMNSHEYVSAAPMIMLTSLSTAVPVGVTETSVHASVPTCRIFSDGVTAFAFEPEPMDVPVAWIHTEA